MANVGQGRLIFGNLDYMSRWWISGCLLLGPACNAADGDSGANTEASGAEGSSSTTGVDTSAASTVPDSTATSDPDPTEATTADPSAGTDPTPVQTSSSDGGDSSGADAEGCSVEALLLIDGLNSYRAENGLDPIPASSSMCTVGDVHAVDLAEQGPHTSEECNLHSWSDAGTWSACCYTPDHAAAQCMWDKPRELTDYPGNGFENAAGGGGSLGPLEALELWKGSPGHNAVMLNEGTWADNTWRAVGAGVYGGYAVLWFGEEIDPAD